MPPEDLIELDAHGVRVRGPAEPGAHDAVGVEQQGGRGLRDVEPVGEVGAPGQVDLDVSGPRHVVTAIEPSSRAVAGHLAQNSVENCTSVAASPNPTCPSSAARIRSPEPVRARPWRDRQSRPVRRRRRDEHGADCERCRPVHGLSVGTPGAGRPSVTDDDARATSDRSMQPPPMSFRARVPAAMSPARVSLVAMSETIPTPYEDLLRDVLEHGTVKGDRTGTGTRSVFGRQLRFDLSKGFPLITTKRVHFRSIAYELLWFLQGSSNVGWLQQNGVTIWDEWADAEGELGPVYGVQWRSWPTPSGETIDQVRDVVEQIRVNPDSRRLIVSAWNPADIPDMALAPCHALFQFYVADGRLSCQLYQRSADLFLGVPFNIASYALLTHMVAQQTGLEVGDFVWTGGDCHIYDNHVEQVREQLSRDPYPAPTLRFSRTPDSIFDYEYDDFVVDDYQHHPAIRAAVAV